MKNCKWLCSAVIAIVVGFFLFGRVKHATAGKTVFVAMGAKFDFPFIDTETGMVTGVVVYNDKTFMTVKVNVHADTYEIDGSVTGFESQLQMTEEECIEHIRHCAKLFVEKVIVWEDM